MQSPVRSRSDPSGGDLFRAGDMLHFPGYTSRYRGFGGGMGTLGDCPASPLEKCVDRRWACSSASFSPPLGACNLPCDLSRMLPHESCTVHEEECTAFHCFSGSSYVFSPAEPKTLPPRPLGLALHSL